MNKNDKIQLDITDMGVDGEGIGKWENYTFFVKNALIGDRVEAVITRLKKGYGYAKTLEILTPSPQRVAPVCPIAAKCGGCQLMEMDYSAQLRFKEDKVRNNLIRLGGQHFDGPNAPEFLPIIGMEGKRPCRYRNKMQFPVGTNREGDVVTGFYAGRTHYIVETEDCMVSPAADAQILSAIRDFIREQNLSVYDEETGRGLVRHVLVRHGFYTGEVLVCLVINGDKLPRNLGPVFAEKLRQLDLLPSEDGRTWTITGICLNLNRERTNVILGDKIVSLYGEPFIHDKIGDLTFEISPLSFFQVNPVQTERLYGKALEFAGLTGSETVWDLYCGAGTISLFLAQKAKSVRGVEIVPPAIENAKRNAMENGIINAEFYCGKSEEVYPRMAAEERASSREKGDEDTVVVLDPPRKGCDKVLLDTLLDQRPDRIVYVSCDSATLARDVKILTESGSYRLEKVQPVDMFPHTVHVETVVLLSN